MSPSIFESSWSRCWPALGAAGDGAVLRDRLLLAYAEPQRKYHTQQHLGECLALCARHRGQAEHPAEVEIALWFHDAVYDVQGRDNEARSAAWARDALESAGVRGEVIDRVEALIMVTRHQALPQGRDQELLVDIDLSILGAVRERFLVYEEQVRAEYDWVPRWLFRRKRREILREFLSRQPIYSRPELRAELEDRARANLAHSIRRLSFWRWF